MFGYQCDTDAGGASDLLPLDDVSLGRGSHESFGDVFDVLDGDARQDDGKLVATETTQDVLGSQAEFESMTECLEQRVAGLVAETVIDRLKLIEIQVQHSADAAATDTGRRLLLESSPVQYARERIVHRIGQHLVLVALALGNVDQRD